MIPIYMGIYENLVSKLDRKEYDYGDMLPTEKELCKVYKISRMTINKVLQMLQQEGRDIRTTGKGTFVNEPQVDKDIFKLASFSEGARLLEYRMIFDVDEKIRERLELEEIDFVRNIKRVFMVDGDPIALDIDRISSKIGEKLNVEKLKDSIYSYFEECLQVNKSHSDFTIKSTDATKEIAIYLHIQVGDPILYMKHVTYTKKGMSFEYCHSYYRADKYSLNIRAYR